MYLYSFRIVRAKLNVFNYRYVPYTICCVAYTEEKITCGMSTEALEILDQLDWNECAYFDTVLNERSI